VLFSNFNDAALKIHQERIEELGLANFETLYDDIRKTRLLKDTFDLVINDFRLNFNSTHQQNTLAMNTMRKNNKKWGKALVSVVGPSVRVFPLWVDQENAPLNQYAPSTFIFTENLSRFCFTVPYYKKLFTDTGFTLIKNLMLKKEKCGIKNKNIFQIKSPHIEDFY